MLPKIKKNVASVERKNNNGDDFFAVEAYKLARTNISLSVLKQGCRRIVITSSLAHEGKTTTSCNIAMAFSKQVDCRTLLIDCDLRKPSDAKFFRIKNTPGLTNYLSGLCELNEVIQRVPNTELDVICAGLIPPNPSELLSSKEFEEMLNMLSERYDYIIIDTPPLNVVVDALPLVKISDGVAIVVFEDQSNYVELDKAVNMLKLHEAKILGFILNGDKGSEHTGYYKYERYYK